MANSDDERMAGEAISAARRLRELLSDESEKLDNQEVIGAVAGGDLRFFVSKSGSSTSFECIDVLYEDDPEKYVWERGCLLRCELPLKLPIYYPVNKPSGRLIRLCNFVYLLSFHLKI